MVLATGPRSQAGGWQCVRETHQSSLLTAFFWRSEDGQPQTSCFVLQPPVRDVPQTLAIKNIPNPYLLKGIAVNSGGIITGTV